MITTTACRQIIVMCSGQGTNLNVIIEAINSGIIPNTEIIRVITNKICNAQRIANYKRIQESCIIKKSEESRESYDQRLVDFINNNVCKNKKPDLIVLAGWMRILSPVFLNAFNQGSVINLHPALPGAFPGANGIRDAFDAFKRGEIRYTGAMVHEVIPEVDAGKVLGTVRIPIYENDLLESLTRRIKMYEKSILVSAIIEKLQPQVSELIHAGKVRELWTVPDYQTQNIVAMVHTDRLSSFDRQICNVPGKGRLLCDISEWWFRHTDWICPNHCVKTDRNVMYVKRCNPIPIEVVVRGYITGSTKTSLWTHYSRGVRNYCGIEFPDGLVKNQELPNPVITPTTKGSSDEPFDPHQGTPIGDDWNRVAKYAMQLFKFGQMVYDMKGLILVDTKYEFGYDIVSDKLTLIDEVHTPDSSRIWVKETYQERFEAGLEPEKLDKDQIRDYLKYDCGDSFDPYDLDQPVPEIPHEKLSETSDVYKHVYEKLTGAAVKVEEYHRGSFYCSE